jgi:predicted Zn-dependent protease
LNVTAYPDSPNTYDSLADAYAYDGQPELAIRNAKRAIQLLASDTKDSDQRKALIRQSAQEKLEQLGASQ